MKRLAIILLTLLIFVYPFAVYFGLSYFSPRYIALGLTVIFLLRFVLVKPSAARLTWKDIKSKHEVNLIIFTTVIGVFVGLISAISNHILAVKLYPVAINLLMFGVFFYSLLYPPTVIERLASIRHRELSDAAIKYTRKVTIVWCIFFVINGAIALWSTLFLTFKVWTFYNGFLSYVLIGAIFATEFTYRRWAKRKHYL